MASNFEFYSPTRVIFGKGTEQRVGAGARIRRHPCPHCLRRQSAVRSGVTGPG